MNDLPPMDPSAETRAWRHMGYARPLPERPDFDREWSEAKALTRALVEYGDERVLAERARIAATLRSPSEEFLREFQRSVAQKCGSTLMRTVMWAALSAIAAKIEEGT